MRGSKAKALRRTANALVLEWLHTLVPDGEEKEKINEDNFMTFLPEDTHYYAQGQKRLHSMTPKWITKKLKKNPNLQVKDLLHA